MAKKVKTSKEKESAPEDKSVIKGDKLHILRQYQKEKMYAIKVRNNKINNWIKNEEAYNGVTTKTLLTRSNLHVPVVFEGVQNMAAKIGEAPEVKYDTIPEGDENAADIMEHVVKEDLDDCDFESLYDNSKIEGGIYGRAIYKVIPGNDKNRVELIDTLAYLISPIAKNTKNALYQGQQFIYKTIEELEEDAGEMEYDMSEIKKLKENKVATETPSDSSSEVSAKNLRMSQLGLSNTSQYGSNVAELTEWWMYLTKKAKVDLPKGKKRELYCVTVANDLYVIRVKRATELGLRRPPFISWGTYTRGITFWCPSVADVYRDPNLAIDVSINQGIDNNTYRNFGMSFVASSSGLKQSSIVPRPLGITPVQVGPNERVQDKIYTPTVPEITSAITTMNVVKGFADSASGLSSQPPTQRSGKMSVTQQAKMYADLELKMSVIRRNATLAMQELFQLMSDITSDRMTTPRPVKIFGYKNLTLESVTKVNFDGVKLVAKAVASEDSEQNKAIKQKAKVDLYQLFKDDPKIPGQLALRRSVAKTFDIDPDELESFFKEEEQPAPLNPVEQPNATPPSDAPTMSEDTALKSTVASAAAREIPRAIK